MQSEKEHASDLGEDFEESQLRVRVLETVLRDIEKCTTKTDSNTVDQLQFLIASINYTCNLHLKSSVTDD